MGTFIEKIEERNVKYQKKRRPYIVPDNFVQQWKESKDYYLNAPVLDPKNIDTKWKKPDFEKLEQYLIQKGFNKKIIEDKVKELKYMYNFYNYHKELFTLSKIKKILEENPLIDGNSIFASSTDSSNSVRTYPKRKNIHNYRKPYIKRVYGLGNI